MGDAGAHKQALVETAMRLFRRQGYASTGLAQILSESGAPKGSLYHYFPGGKEQLGEAAVVLAADRMAGTLAALAERHAAPEAFLKAYARTLAGWMEESDFRSGCPVATTLLETVPGSPRLAAVGERAFDAWIAIVADVFARDGRGRAVARRDAQLVVAAMEGALILARVRRSTRPVLEVAKLARSGAA